MEFSSRLIFVAILLCSALLTSAAQDKGLPFNRYSWLTTHNSFALAGSKSATGSDLITPTNQQDTVTSQLQK
ncbi:hypothetical protein M5K25_002382 [Dendrobium thyrsiflorum]|uniref:Uncharacterized protein n=1 Tax=Dendrobium thyrsiflorum TaxID=117978 RepID=A0ABD0VM12_DENTH